MPVTRAAFWIGALGATGFVPFLSASFFSKELVMHAVHGGHGPFLYWLVFLAELLGIVYIFRMLGYLESVPGDAREPARSGYASESGWPIRLVLLGLTVCAPVFGWLSASPGFGGPGLLYGMLAGVSEAPEPGMVAVAGNAITGILVGAGIFLGFRRSRPGRGVERIFAPHPPLDRNYYFDELYATLILRPLGWIARSALATVEGPFFAGSLRQAGAASLWISRGLRALQNGYVNQYALIVILTTVAILGALWLKL
jgi:NADH:ubiquinone oxidoreductase subunit 5 (subunit L)/multisubunit Na+/H+ antiporter MnhA subunit